MSALVALAAAQPFHQHRRLHEKRDVVVWVTETDVVWETVEITTTVWVDDDATPAPVPAATTSAVSNAAQFYQSQAESQEKPSSTYVAPVASSSPVFVSPTPSFTSVYVAPDTASTYVEPPASSSSSVYVAPYVAPYIAPDTTSAYVEVPASSSTSVYVPPTTSAYFDPAPAESTTPEATPVASSTTSAAASRASPANPSATTCSSDAPCTGDMTYYDAGAGIGACGWTSNTMTDAVIALPHEMMGTQSNGNPYCGASVTISYGGKSIQAKVVDKCMGCTGNSIDLSNKAFDQLAAETLGRVTCEWYFN